jgi:hypothetical protein
MDKRKHPPKDPLRPAEATMIRSACGQGIWAGAQTMPPVLAMVASNQRKIPGVDISLFNEANAKIKHIKSHSNQGLWVFRRDLSDVEVFTWEDAVRACRPDGLSQG